jgi:hypothetical protein
MKKKIFIFAVIFLLLAAISSDSEKNKEVVPAGVSGDDSSGSVESAGKTIDTKGYKEVSGRLSSTVSFVYSGNQVKEWLNNPGLAFVETYVYFEDDLSPTTIFGLDMELLEGMINPIRFAGSDWMASIGLQKNGTVWVAAGTNSTHAGKPSTDRDWQFKQLGSELKSNTWYKLRTVANFDTLEFVSFTVTGVGINKTIDLAGTKLDYPNKMQFDDRALTHYVWTIDGTAIGGSKDKSSSAYFDDISYGIVDGDGREVVLHTDNVESYGTGFGDLGVKLVWSGSGMVIPLENFKEKIWYQERDESLTRPIAKTFARSGNTVIESDAEVRKISREDWLKE